MMERRLAAIVVADVVGYSGLMETDETGTLAALQNFRHESIEPMMARHRGRIVKLMGDGLLVEFASVVDAIECAVAWQDAAGTSGLKFRIGVNAGDVIVEGDDLYGTGVNVAARLEALAEPGGIYLSAGVYNEIRNKLDLAYEDLGDHQVKNISEPVRVFRIAGATAPAATSSAAPLTDKPTIAVLPFTNMSGDHEQEYFADGIAEDIMTLLSRDRWLAVIARNSTFVYKSKSVDVRELSRNLGATYVLEGSVRKAGKRVRITAQLLRGADGHHIWSERYERDFEQIFDVQDQIAGAIVGAISPAVALAQRELARRKPPQNLDAWDLCWQGLRHFYKFDDKNLAEAEQLFERAIKLDPEFAQAITCLAYTYVEMAAPHAAGDLLEKAVALAHKAIALDDRDPWSHFVLGRALSDSLHYQDAIAAFERAIELNPSLALAYFGLGFTLIWCSREREAVDLLAKAIVLSPNDPELWHFYDMLSTAHLSLGELGEAETYTRKALRQPHKTFWPYAMLAAILGLKGETEAAKQATHDLLAQRPGYTCDQARRDLYFCGNQDIIDYFVRGLQAAGVPN